MQRLRNLMWAVLKPKVDALITRRLLLFHDGLVVSGQLPSPPSPVDPTETQIEIDESQRLQMGW
jgi:hypothetical protein